MDALKHEKLPPEEFGRRAAQAGRGEDSCPMYGPTDACKRDADEWRRGYREEWARLHPEQPKKGKRR